jgi:hypothetical protein
MRERLRIPTAQGFEGWRQRFRADGWRYSFLATNVTISVMTVEAA